MIHHISIDVREPLRVARVLAEILKGKVYQFLTPGSFTVIPFDNHGTCIVLFPQGDVWLPGIDVEPAKVIQSMSTNTISQK